MSHLKNLERELSRLNYARFSAEMSDDFCYSNGTIHRIDKQIVAIERQINAARKELRIAA